MQKSQGSAFSLLSPPVLISVSIPGLLRLPNGDEFWWCAEDLTTQYHESRKSVPQHQAWMNWVNGILMLHITGESGVLGPWNPIVVHALCLETCCSRFIHLYLPQVVNCLPETSTHSKCGHTYWVHARDYISVPWNGWAFQKHASWKRFIPLNYPISPVHSPINKSLLSCWRTFIYIPKVERCWAYSSEGRSLCNEDAETTSFWGKVSPGVHWSHSVWQIAPNPSSRGWLQAAVLNWHVQQAWRLAPVSWSICCTAIKAAPLHSADMCQLDNL